jgi:hypothetical protein
MKIYGFEGKRGPLMTRFKKEGNVQRVQKSKDCWHNISLAYKNNRKIKIRIVRNFYKYKNS